LTSAMGFGKGGKNAKTPRRKVKFEHRKGTMHVTKAQIAASGHSSETALVEPSCLHIGPLPQPIALREVDEEVGFV
jgi:hypothetical protein